MRFWHLQMRSACNINRIIYFVVSSSSWDVTSLHSIYNIIFSSLLNFLFIFIYIYFHFLFFYFLFLHGATPPVGQGPFILEASRSHTDTPHSVDLLRTNDLPDAVISTWQHTTDLHAPGRIRSHNPSKGAAADPRLRLRGHWNRPLISNIFLKRSLSVNLVMAFNNIYKHF
jgi:hypothetical protein